MSGTETSGGDDDQSGQVAFVAVTVLAFTCLLCLLCLGCISAWRGWQRRAGPSVVWYQPTPPVNYELRPIVISVNAYTTGTLSDQDGYDTATATNICSYHHV
jgi:hypothetical protein